RYASRRQALAARQAEAEREKERERQREPAPARPAPPKARAGLSWRERQELESLPAQIEALESELEGVEARLGDPDTWREAKGDLPELNRLVAELPGRIQALYDRWAELEARA